MFHTIKNVSNDVSIFFVKIQSKFLAFSRKTRDNKRKKGCESWKNIYLRKSEIQHGLSMSHQVIKVSTLHKFSSIVIFVSNNFPKIIYLLKGISIKASMAVY